MAGGMTSQRIGICRLLLRYLKRSSLIYETHSTLIKPVYIWKQGCSEWSMLGQLHVSTQRLESVGHFHQWPISVSSLWLYSPLLDLGRSFSFSLVCTVSRTPWTGDQSVTRPLTTHTRTQTQNKRTQTSISRVRFERTIPVIERAKTVHALHRASTVVDMQVYYQQQILKLRWSQNFWRL
jgi:hypothetical protein